MSNENSATFNDMNGNKEYLNGFGWTSECNFKKYESTSRLAKAYEVALDIRKFETDLYWKRSTNFWLIIAGISTGLGVLAAGSPTASSTSPLLTASAKEMACLILSCAGSMLCAGWWLANNSSKFWQNNWERQVDILEEEILGPLYKTALLNKGDFYKKSYFSVSEINKYCSIYLCFLYIIVSFYFLGIFNIFDNTLNHQFNIWKTIVFIANLVFAYCFYKLVGVKTVGKATPLDLKIEAHARIVDLIHDKSSKKQCKKLT